MVHIANCRRAMGGLNIVFDGACFTQAPRLEGWEIHAASRHGVDDQTTLRGSVPAQRPSSGAVVATTPARALLDKYCVTCHNQRLLTAGLALDNLDVSNVGAGAEV